MNLINKSPVGFNIRNSKGDIKINKFINTLDYSLDSMKLKEVYEKITRRKNFSFSINNKQYTQMVINIKFSYSYKEFNKCGRNILIKAGYSYNDCDFRNCIALNNNGEVIGIELNKTTSPPIDTKILPSYFEYSDGMFKQIRDIGVIKDKAQLREYLYKNGFICDGIKYVRYKRSCGSSRVGKCLFVNEILLNKMTEWDKCGLTVNEGDKIDLAGYEAYISLPMSSIIDTVEILPENILVIDDYESKFTDKVIAISEHKNNGFEAITKDVEIVNSIWDGQSLMDCSLFGKYSDKGMLLLRNRFFKTCAFNTNIQKFFADNGITSIDQLNGFTLAKSVSEIKLITTPSSIKYVKFGSIQQWFQNMDLTFGIVKHEKKTHFFNGRMVQTHYQLLNSLQLTYEETEKFLQPTLDYILKIKNDPDVLRYHINYPYAELEDNPINSRNEIIFKMLGINNRFADTRLYNNFKNDLIKSMIKELKNGKVLVNGNYSTLLGNGSEMLKASIGQFNGVSELNKNEIRSTRFKYNIDILGSRSPHITMGNIALFKNKHSDFYDKYFNLTQEIVCVNSIGENILQRLNGCDFDSDTVLLTDNEQLINATKKNYKKFKVPTCMVSSVKTVRYYTPEQQNDLDIKTSVNKIGEIVNLSQHLNSLFWNKFAKTGKYDMKLYEDICKLAVASNIEIDRAKKEFTVNTSRELKSLKSKYVTKNEAGQMVRPMFFKNITLGNGYKLSDKNKYVYFETPMDYIQKIVNRFRLNQCKMNKEFSPFIAIIRTPPTSLKKNLKYYRQREEVVLRTIKGYYEEIKTKRNIYYLKSDGYIRTEDEKFALANEINNMRQECIRYVEANCSSENVMYLLLEDISNDENSYISRFMFNILFGTPNKTFFKMLKDNKENLLELVENDYGNLNIYNFSFCKQQVS